jgi:hypothetical protein
LMPATGKLLNKWPPVLRWCWLVTAKFPVIENQLSTSGEDFAVRGGRYCPEWATAITTHCLMWRLAVPLEARRGAHFGTTEGTGRSIRTVSGNKPVSDIAINFHLLISEMFVTGKKAGCCQS